MEGGFAADKNVRQLRCVILCYPLLSQLPHSARLAAPSFPQLPQVARHSLEILPFLLPANPIIFHC